MKKYLTYFLIVGIIIPLTVSGTSAQSVKLEKQVIGTGGMVGSVNSEGLQVSGITGQFAIEKITNVVSGETFNIYQGFWVPAESAINSVPGDNQYSQDFSNYPNPFSTSTKIQYTLPAAADVTVNIYDMAGNKVRVLFDGIQNAGLQQVAWDARDITGTSVTSGSYMYELVVNPAQSAGQSFKPYTLRNVMVIVK